jgi:hypothetical protein
MRKLAFVFFPACLLALLAACTKTQPTPTASESGETCSLVDAGPPPVCPDGCHWNGKECRKNSGIIMEGSPPKPPTPH